MARLTRAVLAFLFMVTIITFGIGSVFVSIWAMVSIGILVWPPLAVGLMFGICYYYLDE